MGYVSDWRPTGQHKRGQNRAATGPLLSPAELISQPECVHPARPGTGSEEPKQRDLHCPQPKQGSPWKTPYTHPTLG